MHYAGRDKEYLHIEKLSNLKSLSKPHGFKVAAFPIKVEGGTGGWTRAVAIEGEGTLSQKPDLLDLSVPLMPEAMEGLYYENQVHHLTHEEEARKFAKMFGLHLGIIPLPPVLCQRPGQLPEPCGHSFGRSLPFWPYRGRDAGQDDR